MFPSRVRVLTTASLVLTPILAAGGQSGVAVSPFVSYIPSAATNPLAGFALTFGGTTGLGLRAGAEMSLANASAAPDTLAPTGGVRPWGADADLMLFLGGLGGGATVMSRALSPYAFAGIGMFGADSAGRNVVHNGWSYGLGAAIPLGMFADIFGEARWRMSEYVLPTSKNAPDSKSSMRFGLSFHVGGGGQAAPIPRRGRYGHGGDESDVEYVVTQPAAAPPVVVVQQPAQTQEPQVIYVEQQPQPEPEVIMIPDRSRERRPDYQVISPDPVVLSQPAPAESRPRTRVIGRSTRSSGATTVQSQSRTSSASTRVAARRAGVGTRTTVGASNRTRTSSRTATSNRTPNRTATSSRTSSNRTVTRAPARAQAQTETKSSAPLSRARVESVRKKKPE